MSARVLQLFIWIGLVVCLLLVMEWYRGRGEESSASIESESEAPLSIAIAGNRGGASIGGVVLDESGQPVAGARIELTGPWDGSVKTGADGKFSFVALPKSGPSNDEYIVSASCEGFDDEGGFRIAAGKEDFVFALRKPGDVRVLVVDDISGKPVTEFEIGYSGGKPDEGALWATTVAYGDTGYALQTFSPENFTRVNQADGAFELRNVDPHGVTVFVRAPGYAMAREWIEDLSRKEITIGLKPSLNLAGRVADSQGNSVPEARIFVCTKYESESESSLVLTEEDPVTKSDAKGEFMLTTLPEGEVWVIAEHPDFARSQVRFTDASTPISITMSKGGSLRGTVIANAKTISGAYVSIRGDGMESRGVGSDPPVTEGKFYCAHLPVGRKNLHVFVRSQDSSTGAYGGDVEVAIEEGKETSVRIDLEPTPNFPD